MLGCIVPFLVPPFFFFASWITMILWGALGNEFDFFTISYWRACLVEIAIWLFWSPLLTSSSFRKSTENDNGEHD